MSERGGFIERLRLRLGGRPAGEPQKAEPPQNSAAAERLDAARQRLKETIEPPSESAEPRGASTLEE